MPKILFLHGYCQNGEVFRSKIAILCKELESLGIQSIFATGPIKPTSTFGGEPSTEFAWWNANADKSQYVGIKDSIEHIKQLHQKEPFQGVFGFSQGAVFAPIVASVIPSVKFVCCVSGFIPRASDAQSMLTFRGPSLHIFGSSDGLVLEEYSKDLVSLLSSTDLKVPNAEYGKLQNIGNATFLRHKGGHLVPLDKNNRSLIVNWIKKTGCPENL